MPHPHPDDHTTALIQRTRETVARSQALRARSAEQLFLARAAIAQAKDEMRRIDTPPAGFDTVGNGSGLSNGAPWRSLGS
jgi:hypothetical protein